MLQLRIAPAFALAVMSLPVLTLAASAQTLSMADRKELRQACGPEIKQLCAGIAPGGGGSWSA
ncbi:cysteine rich repeat-containing protein [Chenggangzhangella methanolivorans]|uniref:cysteine rich repeat-containing protein n=1 Tax=Chenggangzhangella methanolivorans TaxID=1437009 RepID=UPI0021BDE894|nr:cysteine rich repeat-containing protein [Chenggangzhangella methanolivorans]